MNRRPARIRVRYGRSAVRIISQSRNPRGVHYSTGEISVYRGDLTDPEFKTAISRAIHTLFEPGEG